MLKSLKKIIKIQNPKIDFETIENEVLDFLDFIRLNYNPFFGEWLRLSDKKLVSVHTILNDYDKQKGL